MKKQIENIVFYKFNGEREGMTQAVIFYTDGTVKNVSYDDGLDAATELAQTKKIRSKDDLIENFMNKKNIHVMSGEDLERRFQEFVVKPTTKPAVVANESTALIDPTTLKKPITTETNNFKTVVKPEEPNATDEEDELTDDALTENAAEKKEIEVPEFIQKPVKPRKNSTEEANDEESEEEDDLDDSALLTDENEEDLTDDEDELDDENLIDEEEEPKKKGFFRRAIDKIKKSKLVRRIVIFATALALGCGLYSCATHKSKEGQMTNSNIEVSNNDALTDETKDFGKMSFANLLETTPNATQKEKMQAVGTGLDNFNGTFAEAHLESGKDVKAALSWDEMVALKLAYNNYSKDEIKAMFNGADIDSKTLSDAYKMGTLQLMGSYVIETRDSQVNSSALVESEEGKAFVEKYNEMFLQIKEATGQDQINKVNAFYQELYKDFPIADEVREEGIAHSDSRAQLTSYKLAVTPIVGATEMMFQNLEIDHTLSDKAIDYFNDLGLCNIADETFEKVETITLSSETNKDLPLYEQFKEAKIKELKANNRYVIDDKHRDLSQLAEFQKWVNGHFQITDGVFTGETIYGTTTSQTTSTSTESSTSYRTETTKEETSDRDEAVRKTSEEQVKAAEDAVDKQIEKENQQAKEEAQAAADKKAQEEQQKANEDAAKKEEEVKKDQEDLQNKIDDANDQINENNKDQDTTNDKPVNEDDFGDHNVDFDDNHSDDNGNLDNSVEDITTDPSNDKTDEPLPDPNQTGATFNESTTQTESVPVEDTYKESTAGGQTFVEYEEEVSNEQVVNDYVESLDGQEDTSYTEENYTEEVIYTK